MDLKGKRDNGYVYEAIKNSIYELSDIKDYSYMKAQLAVLRNSIGKDISEFTDIWLILLKHIPDEYIGRNISLTAGEQAILHTMQLYALYNQSDAVSLKVADKEIPWGNMGTSLSGFRNQSSETDRVAIDRRFNMIVTADTYNEFLYYLRQMLRLVKSKMREPIHIDFPKLGQHLFSFINGNEASIRILWSREYYRVRNTNKENIKGEKNG